MATAGDGSVEKAIVEKPWQRHQRLKRHFINNGSRYPPFSIEHMPHERQRLSAPGMTDEDRRLRKQWLDDQILAPEEPIYVPEIIPRNWFRRMYGKPMDLLFKTLEPVIGKSLAIHGRFQLPKMLIAGLLIYGTLYQVKYNPNDWTTSSGWHHFRNRGEYLDESKLPPEKAADDFNDKGLKSRKALLNITMTSTGGQDMP